MTLPSEIIQDAPAMHSRFARFWTFEPFAGLFVYSSVHRLKGIDSSFAKKINRCTCHAFQLYSVAAVHHQCRPTSIRGRPNWMQHSTHPGNCSLTCLRLRHCQSKETLGSMHENILFRQRQALKLSVPSSAERPAGGF